MDNLAGIRQFSDLAPPAATGTSDLGQQDFLRLMITQLTNQDPFEPMENGDFLGQMAQFSTVSGIQGLQQSFDSNVNALAGSQALQAASLVDREVLVPAEAVQFNGDQPVRMAVDLPPGARGASISVLDESGAVVARLSSVQAGGRAEFEWSGVDAEGTPLPAGRYRIEAEVQLQNQAVQAPALAWSRVESVSLDGARGIFINLEGLGRMPLDQVTEIA